MPTLANKSMISLRKRSAVGCSTAKRALPVKMIAYLLDLQTISLFDLNTSTIVSQISHDSKIDYLELNANSNKLLFKDKRKRLYIYNLATLTKSTLLPYCTFAKWVPQS